MKERYSEAALYKNRLSLSKTRDTSPLDPPLIPMLLLLFMCVESLLGIGALFSIVCGVKNDNARDFNVHVAWPGVDILESIMFRELGLPESEIELPFGEFS